MKVAYLFSNPRKEVLRKIESGEQHDDHLYGFLRLRSQGIETDYLEVEQTYTTSIARFLRSILNIYTIHLPVFGRIFSYDIVFTAAAYGSQLLHTMLFVRKPKWVMYDFSAVGLIGEGRTLRQKIFKWMVGRASGLVTISKSEAQRLKEVFPHLKERVVFIPFGVDTSFFVPSNTEDDIVFSPGFAPERDYETFFNATESLDIRALLSASRFLSKLEKLPSHIEKVHLEPLAFRDQLGRAKLVVLTLDISSGRNEASGCSTLVEAMAAGRAIIATRTPMSESYIEDGVNGILVPPKDVEALRTAIQTLLSDEAKRKQLGIAARRFVEEHCDADRQARRLADFLLSL